MAELKRVMQLKGLSFEHPMDLEFTRQWMDVMEHMRKWVAKRKADESDGEDDGDGSPFLPN